MRLELRLREEALTREARDTHRLRGERDTLRQEVGQLKHQVQQQTMKIAEQQQEIQQQSRTITELEQMIVKQRKTIKVQSETISGKQPAIELGPFGAPGQIEAQSNFPSVSPLLDPAMPRRLRPNEQPPPVFGLYLPRPKANKVPRNFRRQQSSDLQSMLGYGAAAPPKLQRDLSSDLASLVLHDDTTLPPPDYAGDLQYLFSLSEAWAMNHANIPEVARNVQLSEDAMATFVAQSESPIAGAILNDISTRHFLIARVINNTLTNRVLKIAMFKGFNSEIDTNLQLTKSQIFPGRSMIFLK